MRPSWSLGADAGPWGCLVWELGDVPLGTCVDGTRFACMERKSEL